MRRAKPLILSCAVLLTLGGCAARGSLMSSQQVLTEASFADIIPGMSADEVRQRLGRPTHVFGAGWQEHIQVWNYRFVGGDCVWFQVSIRDADHKVREAGIGQDPACDGPSRTRESTR